MTDVETTNQETQARCFNTNYYFRKDIFCRVDQIADLAIPLCDIDSEHNNELTKSIRLNKFEHAQGMLTVYFTGDTVSPSSLFDFTEGNKVVQEGETMIPLDGLQRLQAISMFAKEGGEHGWSRGELLVVQIWLKDGLDIFPAEAVKLSKM